MSATETSVQTILTITLAVLGSLLASAADADRCAGGETISLSEIWRGDLSSGDGHGLELSGVAGTPAVILEATALLTAEGDAGEPLLTLCSRSAGSQFEVIHRSANRMVLAGPGLDGVAFRVSSQDPLRPTGQVKVIASAMDRASSTKDIEEMEIEPDQTWQCPRVDDHADTAACASPLAVPGVAEGVLANSRGDDADLFAFELTEPQIVILESRGPTDTIGGLADGRGRLLAVDDDKGPNRGFRLVRALTPGRYSVRVEGSAGAEGTYRLILGVVPW